MTLRKGHPPPHRRPPPRRSPPAAKPSPSPAVFPVSREPPSDDDVAPTPEDDEENDPNVETIVVGTDPGPSVPKVEGEEFPRDGNGRAYCELCLEWTLQMPDGSLGTWFGDNCGTAQAEILRTVKRWESQSDILKEFSSVSCTDTMAKLCGRIAANVPYNQAFLYDEIAKYGGLEEAPYGPSGQGCDIASLADYGNAIPKVRSSNMGCVARSSSASSGLCPDEDPAPEPGTSPTRVMEPAESEAPGESPDEEDLSNNGLPGSE
ncbi:hypothetical protein HYH03_003437 [Edaphochlamys debaryana]|uniref:Uncharacterized protein n=1 Tax=Edaphochlamys debaryana TaxID=47281 RepID=A0A835YBW4_9CHLO|nr:hypothetical protein HYH03_003437 [Edaphochlamys debaryana]|eukprot:KAG2498697.1 hypothetical protein HYH03_003437 [Edaphochlamys debaryana]